MNKIDEKTETKKDCPICEMNELMVSGSVAHVACGTIEEENPRGECMAWAAGLDMTKMTAEEILEGAYDRAGVQGVAAFPKIYNQMVKGMIIKKVGEKLSRGLEVTSDEQELYNRYTKEEVAKGI